ncbi:sulfotransferase [Luminiphilus sp.]|nr:sulfotransferase [Luminiphilus sp.]
MSGPVYLKAIPRSGGTLFITLLDAHPEIATSYEIYEKGLTGDNGKPLSIQSILGCLEDSKHDAADDSNWIKRLPYANLRAFLYRARRGGLCVEEIIEELNSLSRHASFDSNGTRLEFIDALMQRKMQKQGKRLWGGKTQADLYKLHDRHPDACFFIMVRDVRDVYASMANRGIFGYTPKQAADFWKKTILDFRKFVSERKPNAMEISYEKLATEPESILTKACERIGVGYSSEMLSFHQKEMTLFKNPHGHLSSQQLQQPLNRQSIGRWRNDLKAGEVDSIMAVAGDLINESIK